MQQLVREALEDDLGRIIVVSDNEDDVQHAYHHTSYDLRNRIRNLNSRHTSTGHLLLPFVPCDAGNTPSLGIINIFRKCLDVDCYAPANRYGLRKANAFRTLRSIQVPRLKVLLLKHGDLPRYVMSASGLI